MVAQPRGEPESYKDFEMIVKRLMSLFSRHSRQRLSGLSAKDTASFMHHHFPGMIIEGKYEKPPRCSRWILLRGPAIGLRGFLETASAGNSDTTGSENNVNNVDPVCRATVTVKARSILAWAEHHANAVWSNQQAEQAARAYLPTWLLEADDQDETVTIPDAAMGAVLEPYTEDFIQKGWARCWCPDCQVWFQSLVNEVETNIDAEKGFSRTTHKIRCPVGHLLQETHREQSRNESVRLIRVHR